MKTTVLLYLLGVSHSAWRSERAGIKKIGTGSYFIVSRQHQPECTDAEKCLIKCMESMLIMSYKPIQERAA